MKPLKWRKYLKLVEFNLVGLKNLERHIFRFSKGESGELKRRILLQFAEADQQKMTLLLVIKLVPLSIGFKLPNLRLCSSRELDSIDDFLHEHRGFDFCEMWCCATPIDKSCFSVAGRILYFQDFYSFGQLVEQVWRCSPRLLEDFSAEFPYPYIRASRPDWGYRCKIQEIHSASAISTEQLERDFFYSMGIIERDRAILQPFTDYLEGFGFKVFNIEYKIIGDKLSVIDWDTPNDIIVLGN